MAQYLLDRQTKLRSCQFNTIDRANRKENVMWRWFLTLLFVVSLGLVSAGCPADDPVVPPVDDPAPEEPGAPPEDPGWPDEDHEPGSP